MKNKYCFLVIILFSQLAYATGDSLQYLRPIDTVFLEINFRGQKLFQHELEKGQTLYSLSHFYGISVNMLYDYNTDLKDKIIHPGTKITVPIPNKAIMRRLRSDTDRQKIAPIYYKVKKGDTMYGIAMRSFRLPVENLMKSNNLTSPVLTLGQLLHVGWLKIEEINKDWQFHIPLESEYLVRENGINKTTFLSKNFKKRTLKSTGKGQWNDKDNFSLEGLYCLHASAPPGSVVRIENPQTKNVTYAKVVGRIPLNYEKWVVIVVSKDVAKALKATDSQFFVHVEYSPL